jgi:DNA-binding transcriptional regulator YiaG
MEKRSYSIEGIDIEVEIGAGAEQSSDNESARNKRMTAYLFRAIREKSGMSRTEFSEWLGIPYRTMQEWELGRRAMPDYVLRLIAYKVAHEKLN